MGCIVQFGSFGNKDFSKKKRQKESEKSESAVKWRIDEIISRMQILRILQVPSLFLAVPMLELFQFRLPSLLVGLMMESLPSLSKQKIKAGLATKA